MSFLKYQASRSMSAPLLLLWCIPAFAILAVVVPGTLQTQQYDKPSLMKMTFIKTINVRQKISTESSSATSLNKKNYNPDALLNTDMGLKDTGTVRVTEPVMSSAADFKDSPPKIDFIKPEYPTLSRKLGEEGDVFAVITITENDIVAKIDIERSSGYFRLDNAVIKALKGAKVVSAVRNGKKVAETLHLGPFQFRLIENSK